MALVGLDPQFIEKSTSYFTGREWVFADIERWLADSNRSPVYLLGGEAGTGKSAILARLVQISESQAPADAYSKIGPNFLAYYHFCQSLWDATLNPVRFVESLSRALADRSQDFAKALLEVTKGDQTINIQANQEVINAMEGSQIQNVVIHTLNIGNISARLAFDRFVRKPLEILDQNIQKGFFVILIDSLDEAQTWREEENILTLLSEIIDDPRDLPAQLLFILSSRIDERIFQTLGMQPSLDLIKSAPPDAQEVQRYAAARLAKVPLDNDLRDRLVARVAESSAGFFLYARYVLDDWLARPEKISDQSSLDLPVGLTGIYRQFLKRELARNVGKWEDRYQPILSLLAVAHGEGLTAEQLAGASRLQRSQVDNALRSCAQYLAGPSGNGPFHLYHQSFRDFLLEDSTYRVYPQEANQCIAEYFMRAFDIAWLGCDNAYALQYTAVHLYDAAMLADREGRKSIGNSMATLVTDLGFCEAKTRQSGIFSLLEDIQLAQQMNIVDAGLANSLQGMLKTLRRETKALRSWDKLLSPAFFAQQVMNRAKSFGLDDLARTASSRLAELGLPYMDLQWLATRQSPELLNVLTGHRSFIFNVAVTNDGRYAVSSEWEGGLKVWNLETGREIWNFETKEDCDYRVAITPDSRLVICANAKGILRFWNLENKRKVQEISIGEGDITLVAATDSVVYALNNSIGLSAWDLRTGQVAVLLVPAETMHQIRMITRDGRYGLAEPDGERPSIWELGTGKRVCYLDLDPEKVLSTMAVSPDGRSVVFGVDEDDETCLEIFSLATGAMSSKILFQYDGFETVELQVTAVAITPDSNQIIVGTGMPNILIYDLTSGVFIRNLEGHEPSLEGGLGDLALTPDGRWLVSGGIDKTVRLWDLAAPKRENIQRGHDKRVIELSVSSNCDQAITASEDRAFKFWNVETGKEARTLACSLPDYERADSIAIHPDQSCAFCIGNEFVKLDLATGLPRLALKRLTNGGGYLDTASGYLGAFDWVNVDPSGQMMLEAFYPDSRARIEFWDLEIGSCLATFRGKDESSLSHSWAEVAPLVTFIRGDRYAVYADNKSLYIVDLAESIDPGQLGETDSAITSIAASPDGRLVLTGTENGILQAWKFSNRKCLFSIHASNEALAELAVTPDSSRAIAFLEDRTLKTWNLSNGKEDLVLEPTEILYLVRNGPEARYACRGSSQSDLSLYDLQTGRVVGKIQCGPENWVCAVSPDQQYVLTSRTEQGFQVWQLPDGENALMLPEGTTCATFSDDNQWLYYGMADGAIARYNLKDGQESWCEAVHQGKIIDLQQSPDGSMVISAGVDGSIISLDMETGEAFSFKVPLSPPFSVMPSALRKIGKKYLEVSYPPASGCTLLSIWDIKAEEIISSIEGIFPRGYHPPLRAIFLADGKSVLYPSGNDELVAYDFHEQREVRRLKLDNEGRNVLALASSEDGVFTAAGLDNGRVYVWCGEQVRTLDKHSSAVLTTAFTPDSRHLITGSSGRTMKVWDLQTSAEIASVAVDGAVERAVVASDGKTILAGDRVGNIYCFRLVG